MTVSELIIQLLAEDRDAKVYIRTQLGPVKIDGLSSMSPQLEVWIEPHPLLCKFEDVKHG